MQVNQMAEKKRMFVDGEEYTDLINVGDGLSEKDVVEVADGNFKRTISNGQKSVTPRECSLAILRNSPVKRKIMDWYNNNETHDVTIVSYDGHGIEFERELLTDCELSKNSRPSWEATSASQAKIDFTLLPYNSVILDA